MKKTLYSIALILCILLIISFYSCKKEKANSIPAVELIMPIDYSAFSALDTIRIKATINDKDGDKIIVSIYLKNSENQLVEQGWYKEFNSWQVQLDEVLVLSDRWLPTGEYKLILSANDGKEAVKIERTIIINGIPKKFYGLIVGVKNLQQCDVYVCDTSFVFEKKYTLNNLLNGFYDYYNQRFVSIKNNGVVSFYLYPEWTWIGEITGLNKVGSPFKADYLYNYPYIYLTNANGSIIAVDKNGNIRNSIKTMFSPFKIDYSYNQWVVLSDYYPYSVTWIEVPLSLKNYQKNGTLVDILTIDENRRLIIEQVVNTVNHQPEKVIWYEYKPLYNILQKFGERLNAKYYDGIVVNHNLYLSIDNSLYELNKIYGTLSPVMNGLSLKRLQYEEVNSLLYGCNQQTLFVLTVSPFTLVETYSFSGEIVFYDFIYD